MGLVTAGWAALPWNPISGKRRDAVWYAMLLCVQFVAVCLWWAVGVCYDLFVLGCVAFESYFWYA